jgi:hypothetical protein
MSIKEGVVKSLNVTHTAEPQKANLRRAEIDRNLKLEGAQNLRESQTPKELRANKIVKKRTQEVAIELEIDAD